ncbi:MAG: ShlB/FhaC/HecB family hemolysin secretion/activation protein [Opitutaceae bacterium]
MFRPSCAAAGETTGDKASFRLKWVLIADSPSKAASLKPPTGKEKLVIEDLPLLGTDEFVKFITPSIGQVVTADLVNRLVDGITDYLKRHGQQLVYVTVPEQNISEGALRIVVVLGRYNLSRIVISDTSEKAAALRVAPGAGQVVIDDAPILGNILNNREFASLVAPLFGRPITDDALASVVAACASCARSHGAVLAAVQIPGQSIAGGELRLAVFFGDYPLRRIIISDTAAAAAAVRPPEGAGAVVAEHSPLFGTTEFGRVAAPYIGRSITPDLTEALKKALIAYARAHDRLLVDVPAPDEDLGRGELRFAVVIGRYNQLVFKGNRWFSNRLLESKLGVKPGDEVLGSSLEAAIDWANQNPFRQVNVMLNTVGKGPGVADLDIAVQEHPPIRFSASYDDTGIAILGENHYTGSIQFGNLWGLDQQATYQFTTTDDSHLYQVHTLDYRIPLPWRNYLVFDADYFVVRPTSLYGIQGFNENGSNEVADLKYVAPMKLGQWSLELSAGIDYKQVNTNLEFEGYVAPVATYDIAQATVGVTAIHRDSRGSWTFGASGDFSPGDFNSRNTDAEFNTAGSGRSARYVYGGLVAQRATALPADFQWISRGQLQLSSTNLQGSEELTVGGMATVRGYDERIFSGDQGWVVNEEVRGPLWTWHLPTLPKRARPLETRLLLFWDYARVTEKHPYAAMAPLDPIMSAGAGIRSTLASNFSLSADFGWQILDTTVPQPNHDRGDIQVMLAY